MNVNSDGGLDLNENEVAVIALTACADALENGDVFDWEDWPMLSEQTAIAVSAACKQTADIARENAAAIAETHGFDADQLCQDAIG